MQHRPRHFRPASQATPLRVTSSRLGAAGAAGIGARIIIGAGIIAAGGAVCDTRQTKRRDDQIKPNATSVCVIGVLHTAMEKRLPASGHHAAGRHESSGPVRHHLESIQRAARLCDAVRRNRSRPLSQASQKLRRRTQHLDTRRSGP
jgi:hypothetical protein